MTEDQNEMFKDFSMTSDHESLMDGKNLKCLFIDLTLSY